MDNRMPIMMGREAAKIMKRNSDLRNIPIIAMTATQEKHSPSDPSEEPSPFDDFLLKPVGKIRLIEMLVKFLNYTVKDDFCSENSGMPDIQAMETLLPQGDPQSLKKLASLARVLEEEYHKRWEELIGVLHIDEIESFGRHIHRLGEDHSYPPVSQWGKNLESQARCIDMEALPQTLNRFPGILESLKKHIQ
jgi:CheY-like chemotaxis protein